MDTLLRRRMMMTMLGGSPTPPEPVLPYDAQIEYLEGDGLAYINTLIIPTSTTEVKYKIYIQGLPSNTSYVGGADRTGDANMSYYIQRYEKNTNRFRWMINYNGEIYISASANTFYEVTMNERSTRNLIVNNSVKGSFSLTINTNIPIFIFARNSTNNTPQPLSGLRLYSLSIYDGTLKRDYIPVRVGTTGYLFDKVSGSLFGNIGTGSFILGNDITQ